MREIEEKCYKPQPGTDCNAAKKCVGMFDQISTYHTALRKTKINCTKNGFELLIGSSVDNAWILYKKIMPKAIPILHFNESLVESLKNSTLQKFCLTLTTLALEICNNCTY